MKPAERSRAAILAAAEDLFARRGYAVTRLEDVADAVGLTRPALFYHFRDKQTLYDAVLETAFGSLAKRLEEAMSPPGSITQRIERAAEAWVDGLQERPTLARLILRHVADAEEHPNQLIYRSSDRVLGMAWAMFEEGRKSGELKPLHNDPFHAASAAIGTSVFYVSALASLIPAGSFKPLAPEQLAAHKSDVVFTVRRVLGMSSSRRKMASKARPAGKAGSPPATKRRASGGD
nr:TetR/AcrR family transcriptional regulator [Solimonas terrae]